MWSCLVRDLMTMSLGDEGAQNCSGHRGWYESISIDRSGLVRVDTDIHVRKGSIF